MTCCTFFYFFILWGESELAKIACSGSLAPHFVNNDCVTAEIICSTAHALGHELLRAEGMCELHLERGRVTAPQGCVCWVSRERSGYSESAARAAVPARSEQILLLAFSSSPLTLSLPTLGSANSADSVNSGTTGTVIRISHTHAKSSKCSPYFTLIAHLCLEQPHLKGQMASGYPLGQSRSRHISWLGCLLPFYRWGNWGTES